MTGNLLAGLPASPLSHEVFETLVETGAVRIERIVSTGQTAPDTGWFDQAQDEWICILDGEAHLDIEGRGIRKLTRGDWLMLPARCRHRVVYTRATPPTVWLAVHIFPSADSGPGVS